MNNQNSCNCNQGGARSGGTCGCGSSNAWQRRTGCSCGGASPLQRRTGCGYSGASAWQRRTNCGYNGASAWQRRTDCGCDGESVTRTTVTKTDCGGESFTITRTTLDADKKSGDCGCGESAFARESTCAFGAPADTDLQGRSLAMVYPPHQEFTDLYDPRQGLCNGTVFCELNKPFYGSGCNR